MKYKHYRNVYKLQKCCKKVIRIMKLKKKLKPPQRQYHAYDAVLIMEEADIMKYSRQLVTKKEVAAGYNYPASYFLWIRIFAPRRLNSLGNWWNALHTY